MPPNTPPKNDSKAGLFVFGAFLMLLAWVAQSSLDSFFYGTSFSASIFHPDHTRWADRAVVAAIQVLFLLYLTRCVKQYRSQQRRLAETLVGAELEKQRAQAFIDAVGDAISIQDREMKVLYQNDAHKALKGDCVGRYCYEAYRSNSSVCEGCHLQLAYQDGRSHSNEMLGQTLDGSGYFEIISTPLRDASGKIVAGIEAVRDISERKKVEIQIGQLNRELELRAEKLVEANRELEAFSYSLSHDLRSYITRVSTAHQVLELMAPQIPEAAFPINAIGESCQGMEELIEAMLTLSQVSRRGIQVEEVNLSEVVREEFLLLQQNETGRQVDFRVQPDVTVAGDRYLLRLALKNLLENAWKYTRNSIPSRIEFGATERDGKRAFFVKDNGIGFSMEEKQRLFLPFQRLANSRGFPGNGIGLATVERVALRLGGEVAAEGEEGMGATIFLILPQPPVSEAAG